MQRGVVGRYGIATLAQLKNVCTALKDVDYTRAFPSMYGATIGGHARHILDHYNKIHHFCRHNHQKLITYDSRDRGTQIEFDRLEAIKSCDKLISFLAEDQLEDMLREPVVVEFVESKVGGNIVFESNVAREIAFVSHHAIHHLSTIRLMMDKMEYPAIDADMGIAPATLNHSLSEGKK